MSSLADCLAARKITKVVYVDDENAIPAIGSIDDVVHAISKQSPRKLKNVAKTDLRFEELIGLREELGTAPIDERISTLTPAIESFIERHNVSLSDFQAIGEILFQGHKGETANRLSGSFPGRLLQSLSFAEWQAQAIEIVRAPTIESRLLLLLDERNDNEPGIDLNGVKLLAGLWRDHIAQLQFIDIIIVTSNCSPQGEFEEATKVLADVKNEIGDPEIAKSVRRAFVISKERIDQDPLDAQFVVHLDRLRAAELRGELIDIARTVLLESVNDSIAWLERIPLSEFQGSVFASSENEGTAEIDTLLRLTNIRQRINLETKLKTDSILKTKIAEMRQFSLKRLDAELVAAAQSELRSLREQEFERPGSQLNSLMAPLASGDVFKLTTSEGEKQRERMVMLLANPCDLVLREDGTRKLYRGLFVEVVKNSMAEIEQMVRHDGTRAPAGYILPTGHRGEDNAYLFRNSNVESIDLSILDLCWSNSDGNAKFDPALAVPAFEFVLPAQQRRLESLAERVAKRRFSHVELWGEFARAENLDTRRLSVGKVSVDNEVRYPISREWRLAPEFASAALMALSQSIARPVFGHDYLSMYKGQSEQEQEQDPAPAILAPLESEELPNAKISSTLPWWRRIFGG